ncbi:MAG TPA: hypothetical protein PLS71_06890, partial [Leptospiraceae bacterium]|nr:hypothetical protein [Leptospiraceae bacterium]
GFSKKNKLSVSSGLNACTLSCIQSRGNRQFIFLAETRWISLFFKRSQRTRASKEEIHRRFI